MSGITDLAELATRIAPTADAAPQNTGRASAVANPHWCADRHLAATVVVGRAFGCEVHADTATNKTAGLDAFAGGRFAITRVAACIPEEGFQNSDLNPDLVVYGPVEIVDE
jgi:hypothetical protein